MTSESGTKQGPRRSPNAEERKRDAERSRQALLSAALDEFSEKGFDRARIQDIADRAGLNKQLIGYYFGGKEGLYREIQRGWRESEADFADPALPLEEVVDRYLRAGLADPRAARLTAWRGLTAADAESDLAEEARSDLANLRRAKERGEIAAELDPAFIRIVLTAIVMAPAVLPGTILGMTGIRPGTPEFEDYYRTQLRGLMRRIADGSVDSRPGGEPVE
ncbi:MULTISPECIES: TetR/AcrR family transcriptional regulator [unclassified Nocardia]|uniref:TetR/AcrR family transcriptional regulator n=1 Tax=unclassified Nocardia TaxID=2637762 RepID=UPI001CE45110|nr:MULTISPECIES: TetR family transcriptional regulator [unclassified Nocardia]